MDVVVLIVQLDQLGAEVGTHAGVPLAKGAQVLAGQHPTPMLGHKTTCTLRAATTCLPRRSLSRRIVHPCSAACSSGTPTASTRTPASAGARPSVRVRPGGRQRRPRRTAPCLPGRGEAERHCGLMLLIGGFSTTSRLALRAAGGHPPARRRHDAHRETDLTLTLGGARAVTASAPARNPRRESDRRARSARPGDH
jgi:hypothetical protein